MIPSAAVIALFLAFIAVASGSELPHVAAGAGTTSAVMTCTACADAIGVPSWLSPVLCALLIAVINVALTEYRRIRLATPTKPTVTVHPAEHADGHVGLDVGGIDHA